MPIENRSHTPSAPLEARQSNVKRETEAKKLREAEEKERRARRIQRKRSRRTTDTNE